MPKILTVFDFDNVLVQTEPAIHPPFRQGLYNHVCEIHTRHGRQPPTWQEYEAVCKRVHPSHGSSVHGWADECRLLADVDKPAWIAEGFRLAGREALPLARKLNGPMPKLVTALLALEGKGHTLAILSHGHAKAYILPMLRHTGLNAVFDPAMVFGIEKVGGHLKSDERPYVAMLNALKPLNYSGYNMVEDKAANLIAAKSLGFTTWLVGERPAGTSQPQVSHYAATLEGVLQQLLGQPQRAAA